MVSSSVQAGEEAWGEDYFDCPREVFSAYPSKSKAVYGVRQHVTEKRRRRVEGRKVGVHVGTLPVRHSGHYDPFDVPENRVPTLALQGRRVGNQLPHVARLDVGEDATVPNVLQVIGNIVDHFLPWATAVDQRYWGFARNDSIDLVLLQKERDTFVNNRVSCLSGWVGRR